MPNSYLRRDCTSKYSLPMDEVKFPLFHRTRAISQMCNISSYTTELLEINSKEPLMQILFIPGNPGIVSFYRDFVEALYENLEGHASITAIGHISQGGKDLERRKMFSLQEQISHKVDYIEQELRTCQLPIVLVGHSIGSYICLEIFKRLQHQVKYFIGLYPFLTLNKESQTQALIGKIAGSAIISAAVSSFASLVGSLPTRVSRVIVRRFLGPSWSTTAIDATCKHLLQYHTMRNVLFMAMTEFRKLSEDPDWEFMKRKQSQIALLFGVDDHWGPLSVFEEVSTRVPGIALSIEREGHTHGCCCTEAGSIWVAHHVSNLIKNQIQIRNL
ncbi:lipid droplet-associated hydrolase-like isoform X5 [Ananas comosus]|nr:lipid droplet-associated hydrolase-like isoform X5 [Ananas comosus]